MSPLNTRELEGVEQPQQDQDSPCHKAVNGRMRCNSNLQECDLRRAEAVNVRLRFPNKVPIILQKYTREKSLKSMVETKFLVPQTSTVSQFIVVIRKRLRLNPYESLYLLVNNQSLVSLSRTLAEVYQEHKEDDGFLHITYASQETFG